MTIPFSHRVVEALAGRETVTADELLPLFPGKKRCEVTKALMNAELRGIVKLDRSEGRPRGEDGAYAPGRWEVLKPQGGKRQELPCVSCVWDLATGPVQIPWMPGRKFSPLGAWNA